MLYYNRNIALACYPLAIQILSVSLLKFKYFQRVLLNHKSRTRPNGFLLNAYLSGRYKKPSGTYAV